MNNTQPGILQDVPKLARYLTFSLIPGVNADEALGLFGELVDGDSVVAGIGQPLLKQMNKPIPGMRDFTAHSGPGFSIPANSAALWLWLRGDDRGELLHQSRRIELALFQHCVLESLVDAFQYQDSRDLTGYVDGTENPQGEDAVNAAIVQNQGAGLDGSSFVAVQNWVHDFDLFQSMSQEQQDNTIGRRLSDNEELDDAPKSAHVKRTAQEDFDPEAFMLRRSMPWADGQEAGLQFVAFGHSFDAFEAQLHRMIGDEDGITDALFSFTHPVSGSYFWCPPFRNNKLDLSLLD